MILKATVTFTKCRRDRIYPTRQVMSEINIDIEYVDILISF